MIGSALDEFASASRALRRLAFRPTATEPDAIAPELHALRARFPDAFVDFPKSSASTSGDLRSALKVAGNRIAQGLTGELAGYAHDRYRQGHYRDAVKVFALVLAVDPGAAAATMLYASALELSHARSGFLKPARRATFLAPLSADGWKLAMRGSFAAGNLTASQNQARRHLLLAPRSGDGWFTLARACFRGGRPEDAYPNLARARALSPFDPDVQLALARCLFRLGRFTDALPAIEQAARLGASGPIHDFEHARIARSAGKLAIAASLLDKLTADHPGYRDKREILELTATVGELRGATV